MPSRGLLTVAMVVVGLLGMGCSEVSEVSGAVESHTAYGQGKGDSMAAAIVAEWDRNGLGQPSQDELEAAKGLMTQASADAVAQGAASAEQELHEEIAAARTKEIAAKRSVAACFKDESLDESLAFSEQEALEVGESARQGTGIGGNITAESLAVVDSTVKSPFAKSRDISGMSCSGGVNCTFDGVGDDCTFKTVGTNTDTKSTGYSLCNSFYQGEGDLDWTICQVMESEVSEVNSTSARSEEMSQAEERSGRRLLSLLQDDVGTRIGRRGKASSTIRRGGAAYTYSFEATSTSYQGNFEEELGEASSNNSTNTTAAGQAAVDLRVQAMGTCTTVNDELTKQGPTCVAAYLHNKKVNASFYVDAADNDASQLVTLPSGCEAAALAGNCTYATNDDDQVTLAKRCADFGSDA